MKRPGMLGVAYVVDGSLRHERTGTACTRWPLSAVAQVLAELDHIAGKGVDVAVEVAPERMRGEWIRTGSAADAEVDASRIECFQCRSLFRGGAHRNGQIDSRPVHSCHVPRPPLLGSWCGGRNESSPARRPRRGALGETPELSERLESVQYLSAVRYLRQIRQLRKTEISGSLDTSSQIYNRRERGAGCS